MTITSAPETQLHPPLIPFPITAIATDDASQLRAEGRRPRRGEASGVVSERGLPQSQVQLVRERRAGVHRVTPRAPARLVGTTCPLTHQAYLLVRRARRNFWLFSEPAKEGEVGLGPGPSKHLKGGVIRTPLPDLLTPPGGPPTYRNRKASHLSLGGGGRVLLYGWNGATYTGVVFLFISCATKVSAFACKFPLLGFPANSP